ncbi:MAG TPA: hypothetical protein VFX51_00605 [Solirubrobacteraceae bacterium]|nr:hypothetical protein [Solirubrobacteraceae bacterium]
MTIRLLALLTLAAALAAVPSSADAARPKKQCMTGQFTDYKVMRAGSARVLYARGGRKAAAQIAGYVRETYPKFKALLHRTPPSDARERCFHGPNGKLDVYVTKAKRFGTLEPKEEAVAFVHPYVRDENCLPKKPVFAVVRPDARPAIVAHELWHAFQAAYATKGDCDDYSQWNEAMATWAGDYAYPTDDVEHSHDSALKRADVPLHFWGYATWVFPLYLSKTLGTDVIRAIEESRERYPTDVHIDRAMPGGIRKRFPDFSLYAYNQAPAPASYTQWDRLATTPSSPSKALARGDNPLPMETLRVLSREYRRVRIDEPDLRKIEFHNPGAKDPDLHVRALVRRADGSWRSENWDGRTRVDFCRDQPGQDVREIILAYSNSSFGRRIKPVTRFQADTSCSLLRFKVLAASVQTQTNAAADHILCGRQSGRITFGGSGNAPYKYATNTIEAARGQVEGSIGAKVVAGWSGHHLEGCKIGADGLEPCSVDMPPESPRPDGTWGVSFSVSGGANDDNWTVNWAFDDPSVGFMDAGPDECFVYIWGSFDQAVQKRQVPRATFLQTKPFTLTFEGTGNATNTMMTNATINHEWQYSLTIQRVG